MSSVKILKQKKTPGGTETPGEVLCQVGDHSPGDGVDDQGPRPRPRPWSASPRNGIPLAQSMELMTDKQFFKRNSFEFCENQVKYEEKKRILELAILYCCFH